MKCPKCHEGQFFESHPYDLKNAGEVLDHCPVCDMKYSREPGFFYGALYVAYALGVAIFVTLWVSMNLFFNNIDIWVQISVIVVVSLLATPYVYALSKIIWINLFYSYDKERGKSKGINKG